MSARTSTKPNLRAARLDQVAKLIADVGDELVLGRDTYRNAAFFQGLTRQQLDLAIDDLIAADRVELTGNGGALVARLVREAGQ